MFPNLQTIYAEPATIKTYLAVFELYGYWTPHLPFGRPTFFTGCTISIHEVGNVRIVISNKSQHQLGLLYTIIPLKLDTNLTHSFFIYLPDGHII